MKVTCKYILSLLSICFLLACSEKHLDSTTDCKQSKGFPQIHINTKDSCIVRDKYSVGKISFADLNECLSAELKVSIKGRGNTSWSFPKKSYQFKFEDTTAVLTVPAARKFILTANYSDKTMLRNELAFFLSRLSKLTWTPKSKFVEVTLNEQYLGVYQLTQKLEIAANAIDPSNADVLLEIDHKERLHPNDIFFETAQHLFCIKSQKEDSITDFAEFENYLKLAEASILNRTNYSQFFNIITLVDWYLINEIAKNNDALFNSSVYLHFKLGEKIHMGPVWDYDISFGNINYNGNDSVQGFFIKKSAYFEQLFKQDDFVNLVKERYNYFYSQKTALLLEIDKLANLLRSAADRNFEKWPILGRYIWPNNEIGNTYQEEVDYLKYWLTARMDWLDKAISEL